jgi:hypothetical protein
MERNIGMIERNKVEELNMLYDEKRQSFIDSFKKTDYKKNDLRYFLFYYKKDSNYYRYFW